MLKLTSSSLLLLASGLVAASVATSAFADANKKVKIINETRHAMVQFHASRVGTNSWEEDILGRDTLGVGRSVVVNFGTDDYCLYDFLGVFDDGDKVQKRRINVCEIDTFRFTED
ncbi:MAG: hypothetical protein GC190_11770 [Alphaproteobacteria bacterium]|nr:hypothetical protein [Alphaproteobacteria bacterium]